MLAGGVGRAIRDGDWQLFDWDPATGRTVWVLEQDGMTHYRTDYPVASLIEQNAEARNNTPDGWKGDWHRVASIPLNLVHDENLGLHRALIEGDEKYVKRFLNDSDNRAWRTKDGHI